MAVLGAEQIRESKITLRYFDKYMLAVNIGGIIATGVSLSIYSIPKDQTKYYIYSAIAATSSLFIATVLIIIGYRFYIDASTHETVATSCIPVIINAFQARHRYDQRTSSEDNEEETVTSSNLLNASDRSTEDDRFLRTIRRPSTLLDFAKLPLGRFRERIVDEVKSLRGLIIVFILLTPYWIIYNQVRLFDMHYSVLFPYLLA